MRQGELVYGGVDTSLFTPGSRAQARERLGIVRGRRRSCCSSANLLPVKGLDVLIEAACARLGQQGVSF